MSGFCVKVRTKKGEKVFINVCHTKDVPKPKGFCIPMSIGNEKEVFDKGENHSILVYSISNKLYFIES